MTRTILGVSIRTDYDHGMIEVNCHTCGPIWHGHYEPNAAQARDAHLEAAHAAIVKPAGDRTSYHVSAPGQQCEICGKDGMRNHLIA